MKTKQPREMTLEEFLSDAAAAKPVPGGGGIAAVAGALAASMAEMALNFTVGKKKYASVDACGRKLLAEISAHRDRLMDLVRADGEGYHKVAAALKMPRETDEEKKARRLSLNAAMREALEAPLEIARIAQKTSALLGEVLEIGNPNLSGDVAVAATLLPGAARAAALNVWANVSALEEPAAREVCAEVASIIAEVTRTSEAVYSEVEGKLCPHPGPDPTSA